MIAKWHLYFSFCYIHCTGRLSDAITLNTDVCDSGTDHVFFGFWISFRWKMTKCELIRFDLYLGVSNPFLQKEVILNELHDSFWQTSRFVLHIAGHYNAVKELQTAPVWKLLLDESSLNMKQMISTVYIQWFVRILHWQHDESTICWTHRMRPCKWKMTQAHLLAYSLYSLFLVFFWSKTIHINLNHSYGWINQCSKYIPMMATVMWIKYIPGEAYKVARSAWNLDFLASPDMLFTMFDVVIYRRTRLPTLLALHFIIAFLGFLWQYGIT